MTNLFYMTLYNLNQLSDYKNGGRRGRFYLVNIKNNGLLRHVTVSNDIFYLIQKAQAQPFLNWFITPNTLRTNRRFQIRYRNDGKYYINTRVITSFYLDLDVIKSGIEMNDFRKTLPKILDDCEIKPTAVIKSGHGYHIIITLDKGVPVNSPKVSRLWSMIEESLIDTVTAECQRIYHKKVVDPGVSDITRVLRIIGTHNMKDENNPISVTIKYLNRNNRPTLREMQQKWSPHYKHVNHPYNTYYYTHNHRRKTHHNTGKTIGTLNQARRSDIFKLAELRENEAKYSNDPIFVTHFREYALFYYTISSVMAMKNKAIRKNLISLNNKFNQPLPYYEVQHVINEINDIKNKVEVGQLLMKKYRHEYKYKKLGYFPGNYTPTNKLIVKRLNITPAEQRHMRTLIGQRECNRRYRERLLERMFKRAKRTAERKRNQQIKRNISQTAILHQHYKNDVQLRLRNIGIIILHGMGLSIRAIANQVNIGKTAVNNVIKYGVHLTSQNTFLTSGCRTELGNWLSDDSKLIHNRCFSNYIKIFEMVLANIFCHLDTGSGFYKDILDNMNYMLKIILFRSIKARNLSASNHFHKFKVWNVSY